MTGPRKATGTDLWKRKRGRIIKARISKGAVRLRHMDEGRRLALLFVPFQSLRGALRGLFVALLLRLGRAFRALRLRAVVLGAQLARALVVALGLGEGHPSRARAAWLSLLWCLSCESRHSAAGVAGVQGGEVRVPARGAAEVAAAAAKAEKLIPAAL